MEMHTVACYPSVSTTPYTRSHPYCISSHPAIIPRREEMYNSSNEQQEHFRCSCSDTRASCNLWIMRCGSLGRCGRKQSLSLLSLTLPCHQWPRYAHDEEAKPITALRLKHHEMMTHLCPPPPEPGAEISSLACCPSSRRRRGHSLLQPHHCFSSQPHP